MLINRWGLIPRNVDIVDITFAVVLAKAWGSFEEADDDLEEMLGSMLPSVTTK